MKKVNGDKQKLEKLRYIYKLKILRVNDVNTDIDFKNNYFNNKKRWL